MSKYDLLRPHSQLEFFLESTVLNQSNSKPLIQNLSDLEATMHNLIPISQHMGVKAESYDGQTLALVAPLANNINHQGSAFGGSLFSLSALVGWGIIQLKLGELNIQANTVVAGGEVSYHKPVFDQLHCQCTLPAEYPEFVEKLTSKGKASIKLQTEIVLPSGPAMVFEGKFVIFKEKPLAS